MAITGPFIRTRISNAVLNVYQSWYRQTPPYRERLNYEMRRCALLSWYNQTYKDSNNPGNQSYNPLDSSPAYQPALNLAYERFKGKVADKAEIASSLGEGRQAVDMMSKRLVQMTSFVKALRRGDISSASKALGMAAPRRVKMSNALKESQFQEARRVQRNLRNEAKPASSVYNEAFDGFNGSPAYRAKWPKRPKKTARDFGEWVADTFLEFHFGWVPLVKDIASGVEVLQSTFPPYTVRATGVSAATQGLPKQYMNDPVNGRVTWWRSRVQLIANISITNPNLWLANQLGFVNPVSWLWEWTLFSFIVDWFTNVGAFLSQCTDFLGLAVEQPATTHVLEHTETVTIWSAYTGGLQTAYVKGWYCMRRSTGLSKPALQMKPFQGFSLTRGVTAASLLLQQLKGIK